MKKKKTTQLNYLLGILIIFMVLSLENFSYADEEYLVDITQGSTYSSDDFYKIATKLAERYPEIIHMEMLGKSFDFKPIYSIVLTKDIKNTMQREDFKTFRQHYLVEAGTHARETINTFIVLKQIEDYAIDYYNDSHIPEFSLSEELGQVVMHFLPLTNPDGYDLTKIGISSVKTKEGLKILDSIKDKDYLNYKAGITGVDYNRNYPSMYLDLNKEKWVNNWQKVRNTFNSYEPAGQYYSGISEGSEPEVRIVMDYIKKYDFRNYISFHSRGNIIYWHKYYFSDIYNKRAKQLADAVHKQNKYRVMPKENGKGSGYLSDFTTSETLKPLITIETLPGRASLPAKQRVYSQAYEQNKLVPLLAVKEGKRVGYHKYRLYIDNIYVRDFEELIYANAHAEKIGGEIVEGIGVPEFRLEEPVTRKEFLDFIISKNFDKEKIALNPYIVLEENQNFKIFKNDELNAFKDDKSISTSFARFLGIVSSDDDYFRPDDPISPFEATMIIYNTDKILNSEKEIIELEKDISLPPNTPNWATDATKYVLAKKYFQTDLFRNEFLYKDEILD